MSVRGDTQAEACTPNDAMNPDDTIVAISSAVGRAQRMIVRVSGSLARQFHTHLIGPTPVSGATASRQTLQFDQIQVPAWVYTFVGPTSATGEDVTEFHIPGNPILARMLVEQLVRLGARLAEPGEFTARAYFNGKIDLTEAEGVAATIAAQNQRELEAARQLLAGELARRLKPAMDELADTLALIEVGIDFSDQDVSFLSSDQINQRIDRIDHTLETLLRESARFERLSHEPQIVLAGRPHAGKSTLLNALAGYERAVVSPQAGTTRDAIWSHVRLPRGIARLIDVAGLDEPDEDPIARQMQQRAQQMIQQADLLVLVRDGTDERPAPTVSRNPDLRLSTKSDLGGACRDGELPVSARTGANLDLLRHRLDALAFGPSGVGNSLALNSRHVQAVQEARAGLSRARAAAARAGSEFLALDLREALDALGAVLGSISPDDLLGRIFSSFCIGK
jgi:tRNA modification GTPase